MRRVRKLMGIKYPEHNRQNAKRKPGSSPHGLGGIYSANGVFCFTNKRAPKGAAKVKFPGMLEQFERSP